MMCQTSLRGWSGKASLGSWAGFKTGWEEGKGRERNLPRQERTKGFLRLCFSECFMGPFGVGSEDLLGEWYFLSG